MGGGRIENRLGPFPTRQPQRRGDCIERRFQLEQRVFGLAETCARAFHIGGRKHTVGACGDNNRVLSGIVHSYERHACGFVPYGDHGADVHARRCKTRFQVIGEHVVADASYHANQRIACEPARGASLVGALAARNHLKAAAEDSFSGLGQSPCPNHEIHVQTAQHDNRRFHRVRSMPSFFSSSA